MSLRSRLRPELAALSFSVDRRPYLQLYSMVFCRKKAILYSDLMNVGVEQRGDDGDIIFGEQLFEWGGEEGVGHWRERRRLSTPLLSRRRNKSTIVSLSSRSRSSRHLSL